MAVDLPRHWRWVIGSGCAVIVGLAFWMVFAGRAADAKVSAVLPSVVATDTAGRVAAAVASESAESTVETATVDVDSFEPCGGRAVSEPIEGQLDVSFERVVSLPSGRDRLLESLQVRPDDLSRAAVLMIRMFGSNDPSARLAGIGSILPCGATDCRPDPKSAPGIDRARNDLARLAIVTTDPRVYALAFRMCQNRASEGACSQLSAAQWARLDPDNGSPWLYLLASAQTQQKQALVDEALFHLSRAKRGASGLLDVAGAIVAAAPEDDSLTVATLDAVASVIGVEFAVANNGGVALNACRAPALVDPNRLNSCSGVADYLVDRADTLIDRAIGVSIGKRVGWSADRVDRLRGEYDEFTKSLTADLEKVQPGCQFFRHQIDQIRERARFGETGALRAFVAASGKTADDFIRARREQDAKSQVAQAAAEVARAASAAASGAAR